MDIDLVIELAQENDGGGICIACGNFQYQVEPDAEKYKCESCGERKVYGAAQAILLFA